MCRHLYVQLPYSKILNHKHFHSVATSRPQAKRKSVWLVHPYIRELQLLDINMSADHKHCTTGTSNVFNETFKTFIQVIVLCKLYR